MPDIELTVSRRSAFGLIGLGLGSVLLGSCEERTKWHGTDITGTSPALSFTMAHAPDGKEMTEVDFRGKVVMLYLGYTFCPDICPTTLASIAEILAQLGADAGKVTVLFVTVDPDRDTLSVLADYVGDFAPQIVGLRGTPDQLAVLARRYRLAYSVTPATDGRPYEVTHSSAIYVFDGSGAARVLVSSLGTAAPNLTDVTADLKRLVAATHVS
ncbi:electron transporter SenC [Mesorhizobium sanjuanii]|uniref:Electron transporter SenC n=1 Tax=Mesorhizobium sanjuanii TaxID=2037900 RepID=A0A2A6F9Y3_9HYPH|nr:SCO family protein [Mesorhizobium sanjuanii]PDQ18563.1 electron transporter SenC [Mesorhizobium sanjuanii]